MNEARHDEAQHDPFDTTRLDALLEDEGIDVLAATSKHNVQYLLGGYRFFFFDYMDAIGVSRYLPVVVYQKGRPDNTAYIGHPMESHEQELGKFWPRVFETTAGTSGRAARSAAAQQGLRFSRRPMSLWTPRPTGYIWILWRMAWASSVMKRRV